MNNNPVHCKYEGLHLDTLRFLVWEHTLFLHVQNGEFWKSSMRANQTFNHFRTHEHQFEDVIGKVEGGWPIAESRRNTCPISLEVLRLFLTFRNEASNHLQ